MLGFTLQVFICSDTCVSLVEAKIIFHEGLKSDTCISMKYSIYCLSKMFELFNWYWQLIAFACSSVIFGVESGVREVRDLLFYLCDFTVFLIMYILSFFLFEKAYSQYWKQQK